MIHIVVITTKGDNESIEDKNLIGIIGNLQLFIQ